MKEIVSAMEKICNLYIAEQGNKIRFKEIAYNNYVISGVDYSPAINNWKNALVEINALRWFNDFWLYISFDLENVPKLFPRVFISLSVFQGAEDDQVKSQLFRAEWDNYADNTKHPQPHWHVYPNEYNSKYHDDFQTFVGMKQESFTAEINNSKNGNQHNEYQLVAIKNFHFAMDAQWSSSDSFTPDSFIHKVTDEQVLINWMGGLLQSVRQQLEHLL